MSGSQGAFLNALDPLSGMTNPFEFSNQVSQARKNALEVQGLQGQKVWGQSLLKNTDANGNVDYQGAARDAAAAGGPAAAMAARSALGDMGNQRGQQIINAAGMYKTVGIGAMGLAKDPSDANVNAVFDNMAASGIPVAQVNAERQRVLAMTNPVDRQNYAMQHGLSVLDQLHQVVGQTTAENFGNRVGAQTVTQPTPTSPGTVTGDSGGIPTSMRPGEGPLIPAVVQTPNGPVTVQIPYQQAFPGQVTPGAATTPAGVPAAGTIPANPNVPAGTPPGRIMPPPGLGNPNKALPGAAPETPLPAAPVVQTPIGPGVVTTAPLGTEQDVAAYKAAQAAMPDQQKNVVAGQAALQALQLARSGPGTATTNAWKSFMIAQGIPGADQLDTGGVEAYQIARKNLLRFAQSSGGRVGTDLGLATQIESNPNTEMLLNNVNDHILKQDLGLARQRIAQTLTAPGQSGTGKTDFGSGMGAHVQNFTAQTDPVAFAWDLLTPQERTQHMQQIEKTKGGVEKWERSMKIARDTGVWSAPTTQAPAQTPATTPPVAQPPHPLLVPNG